MSGARSAWALAFICTSLAAVSAGAEPADAVSLELDLARKPALYLVIEGDPPALSVRVRGLELDAVPLRGLRIAWQGGGAPPTLALPQLWRVTEAPEAEWRRVVAPPELIPYEASSEEDLRTPLPSPTPPPPRPHRFAVATDSGWRLAVATSVAEVAPVGLWRRVARGWQRLLGEPDPAMPPTLVVVVAAEDDARRVVHLVKPGTAVLVGGRVPVASVKPAPEPGAVTGRP